MNSVRPVSVRNEFAKTVPIPVMKVMSEETCQETCQLALDKEVKSQVGIPVSPCILEMKRNL